VRESEYSLTEYQFACNKWVEVANDQPALQDFSCTGTVQLLLPWFDVIKWVKTSNNQVM
jgi:hypothetical protein